MPLTPLAVAWFSACVILMIVFGILQSRYVDLLRREYPDSEFAMMYSSRSGQISMPWDRIQAQRRLQRERAAEMPMELQQARKAGFRSWVATGIAVFSAAILIPAGAILASGRQVSNNRPEAVLVVLLAAAIVLTAIVLATAATTPPPTRWLYLAGGILSIIGVGLLENLLVG